MSNFFSASLSNAKHFTFPYLLQQNTLRPLSLTTVDIKLSHVTVLNPPSWFHHSKTISSLLNILFSSHNKYLINILIGPGFFETWRPQTSQSSTPNPIDKLKSFPSSYSISHGLKLETLIDPLPRNHFLLLFGSISNGDSKSLHPNIS